MNSIIIENDSFRLILGEDAIPLSLICKASNEECLCQNQKISLFSVTQLRPFNNEIKLAYPNKRTTFEANRVRQEGDRLYIGFEIIPYEAIIKTEIEPDYIEFILDGFVTHPGDYDSLEMDAPPVEELRLLQLPVADRKHYGDWMNVVWDEKAAINVMATSPYARIDSERRKEYRLMTADAVADIKLMHVGAALIVKPAGELLGAIDQLERKHDLPRGAYGRRSGDLNAAEYWTYDISPENVDEHIRYAKLGGFRQMLIYYTAIFKSDSYCYCGNYDDCDYRPEYPNKYRDLVEMLNKIKAAGIIPGIHFLQTFIGTKSRYVTPVADPRINKKRWFMLSNSLSTQDTTIYVEQNPEGSVMHEKCRVLQFGGEMVQYEGYTTEPPYAFTGCQRGWYGTTVTEHAKGEMGGIADVCEFGANSLYLDQNTSLSDEIAEKLAHVYNAGFEFVYFDGSEGTNAPFEFHVPNAQYRVIKKMNTPPRFSAGAAKAHFSWHYLYGGNAFDVFNPDIFKEKIIEFPCEEAPRMRNDFTCLNFGWWRYWAPETADCCGWSSGIGIQPDMYEFGISRAAAWECPVTMQADIRAFQRHPRTEDNFEVFRRWEEVRANGWLTDEWKEKLKDYTHEHILLVNEEGAYELVEYRHIQNAAGGNSLLRAFVFERNNNRYVVYWHTEGSGTLKLPLQSYKVEVVDQLGGIPIRIEEKEGCSLIPVDGRRYLKSTLSYEEIERAFVDAVF